MRGKRFALVAALAGALGIMPAAAAQGGGDPPGALVLGRLHYDGGGDWYANPSALSNLAAAVRAQTAIPVAAREQAVRLDDPALWDLAFLHATGHGNLRFAEAELPVLRRWLVQGGFLHVDDNYGLDVAFRREVARLFPDRPLVEVPLDHPIYSVVHRFPEGVPKIHEHDGDPARGYGIFVDGRLVLFYSHQSDLSDGWEDPEVHGDAPAVREAALRMGVNLVAYAVGWGG
jgi:hypothetical protein